MRRAPAHAGSLKPWERLAFALAFALMAAFVVVVTFSAAREHSARSAGQVSSRQSPGGRGGTPAGNPSATDSGGSPGTSGGAAPAERDQQLADALAPVLLRHAGNLAVGVIDRTTGVRAVYDGRHAFDTAGIVRADILAVLLLQGQQAATIFGEGELQLAVRMMQTGDAGAATDLWVAAGGAGGVAAANAHLGLRHTTPGPGIGWGQTSTTVPDQLRLLADLTSPSSPLTAASRSYELSLMRAGARQRWGVPAAATAGDSSAVRNGSRADPRGWVVSSIGVIHHASQVLLVAVLSDGQPTRSAGIAADEAAAVAAVTLITARGS